ncbi:PD-(D/E)XK motif protein [Bradyrhizobium tropiciagri]|uniref:PD-(D/E)XK motif protein n=1 Tax=Bradyrhizobium tropiciagri TaxID=312253 RepID=UPI000A438D4C|nr:PD-(D/E)XK motif protein [Bradyrhizobium tropiciagri]
MGKQVTSASRPIDASRHLRWESFEKRIRDGLPSLEPIKGSPRVVLFITPGGSRIGAHFFTAKKSDLSSPLAEIAIRNVGAGPQTAVEVSTGNPGLFQDFYAFCCTVADRVQIDQEPVESAISKTLASWSALIRQKRLLSESVQTGLFGELMFLKRVAGVIGWRSAVDAWQGPASEEHDFTLPATDVEVKSTRGENRIHQIGSLTQLMPKAGRRLAIASVQLTLGTGRGSQSLPQLIASVLSTASAMAPQTVETIRHHLTKHGWADEDASQYGARYHLRSPMTAIPVDKNCPVIVPDTLSGLGLARFARIEKVEYALNLDGLGALDGSSQFDRILFRK